MGLFSIQFIKRQAHNMKKHDEYDIFSCIFRIINQSNGINFH